jgi:hypothetical protein
MQKPNKQSEPKKDPVAPYQPTPEECRGLEKLRARDAERTRAPHVKAGAGGQTSIAIDHPHKATGVALLRLATGSEDNEFLAGLLTNFGNIGGAKNGDGGHVGKLNFLLSLMKGVKPRDQVEAMLAAQMAVTHDAMMTFARRLAHAEMIEQQDSAERGLTKLSRTFAMQVEALKRYRSQGEQVVRVERVTVHEGGQAIVGNVSHGMGGRGAPAKVEQSP